MKMHVQLIISVTAITMALAVAGRSPMRDEPESVDSLKVLIIDGQNNHDIWPKTTMMMQDYLEQTGLFEVDIERSAFTWNGVGVDQNADGEEDDDWFEKFPLRDGKTYVRIDTPKHDKNFNPDFSNYDVVVSNFGWLAKPWPKSTQRAFEKFVRKVILDLLFVFDEIQDILNAKFLVYGNFYVANSCQLEENLLTNKNFLYEIFVVATS